MHEFNLFQDWELQRERLNVRHAGHQRSPKSAADDKNVVCTPVNHAASARQNEWVSDITASHTGFSREDYRSGCSHFWTDVPHQSFKLVGKKKKNRRRISDGPRGVCGHEKMQSRQKKRKKKHRAYLVSEALLITLHLKTSSYN